LDIKPYLYGIGARLIQGAEVRFPYMDRAVTLPLEPAGQQATIRLHSLHLPVGRPQRITFPRRFLFFYIIFKRPVGDIGTPRISSRNDTAPSGRANGTGSIGIGEEPALLGQPFHIRRLIALIEGSFFRMKGNGGILPS